MNGFCGDCDHLKEGKQRGKHFCDKYNKFVKHLEHYREIIRLEECVRGMMIKVDKVFFNDLILPEMTDHLR